MNRNRKAVIAGAFIAVVMSCRGSLDPLKDIELRTEVAPAVVSVGDTVTIRAILRNTTSKVIEPGLACGPPVLFELRGTGGDVVHPIRLDGAFACPFLDYHRLEPFETDTVVTRWRVGLSRGDWSVRSGFRSGAKLERLSPAVSLTVE